MVPGKAAPSGIERERIVEAALGLTADEAENVFAKSLVQTGQFDIDVILSEKERIVRKSGVLEFFRTQEKMDNIGGLDELKSWLKKRQTAFSEDARNFGLPRPKGILMLGIPGGGKSLTAKAVGASWRLPLLRLDVGKVFAGIVGSSEENMRRAIQMAEAVAPSICGSTNWRKDSPAPAARTTPTAERPRACSAASSPGCRRRPARCS